MVGQRVFSSKTRPSLALEAVVPKTNFYRRVKQMLDLDFLYEEVKPYYGACGQKSADPVVFFKLLLVGHFENLLSDRAIIQSSQLRLDILYFLDYKVGERLPCPSTVSRTRKRLPIAVFEACFEKILHQCIEAGLVSGHTQTIDAAYVEANASMDSLKLKAVCEWQLLPGEGIQSAPDGKVVPQPSPFSAVERVAKPGRTPRRNQTHWSPVDGEARLAQKANKPLRLYYSATRAVDTHAHVITHIQADMADERDSMHLLPIVRQVASKLKQQGFPLKRVVADGAFGSGLNYALLESEQIQSFVALPGSYHPLRDGFTYDATKDHYLCQQGKVLHFRAIRMETGYPNRYYFAQISGCKACPVKQACCGNKVRQVLTITAYQPFYQRMQQRLESREGRRMKKRRQSTVEPVFGSLLNYFGMRRARARGKTGAHKIMLAAATAYNLQKLTAFPGFPKATAQRLPLAQTNRLPVLTLLVVPHSRSYTER
jgi:transposase